MFPSYQISQLLLRINFLLMPRSTQSCRGCLTNEYGINISVILNWNEFQCPCCRGQCCCRMECTKSHVHCGNLRGKLIEQQRAKRIQDAKRAGLHITKDSDTEEEVDSDWDRKPKRMKTVEILEGDEKELWPVEAQSRILSEEIEPPPEKFQQITLLDPQEEDLPLFPDIYSWDFSKIHVGTAPLLEYLSLRHRSLH